MVKEPEVLEKTFVVTNRLGIHARVATMMVQTMKQYASQVTLAKDGVEADARSVLGLLLLAATHGTQITIRAHGTDCDEALREISKLIQDEDSE